MWIPKDTNVHYEIELAVIMGWNLRHLAAIRNLGAEKFEETWKRSIRGYAIGMLTYFLPV